MKPNFTFSPAPPLMERLPSMEPGSLSIAGTPPTPPSKKDVSAVGQICQLKKLYSEILGVLFFRPTRPTAPTSKLSREIFNNINDFIILSIEIIIKVVLDGVGFCWFLLDRNKAFQQKSSRPTENTPSVLTLKIHFQLINILLDVLDVFCPKMHTPKNHFQNFSHSIL